MYVFIVIGSAEIKMCILEPLEVDMGRYYGYNMLISFFDLQARAELERKEKRQREGIEAMKRRGEWERYGRRRIMAKEDFAKEYERVLAGKIGSLALMRELGLSHNTFFRYVKEYKEENIEKEK